MEKETQKFLYIPGWLDRAEYNGLEKGLDIWGADRKNAAPLTEKYIVAHSLGCHWAVLNWHRSNGAKLILVNPLFPKRGWLNWVGRWAAFFFNEGRKHTNPQRIAMFKYVFQGIKDSISLLRNSTEVENVLAEIPKEKVVIVRGERDLFFCNQKSVAYFEQKSLQIFQIKDLGHVFELSKLKKVLIDILD